MAYSKYRYRKHRKTELIGISHPSCMPIHVGAVNRLTNSIYFKTKIMYNSRKATQAEAVLAWLKTKDMIAVMKAGVSMPCRPGLSLKLLGSGMRKKSAVCG